MFWLPSFQIQSSSTPEKIRVTVWGENIHERQNKLVRQIYPEGMHHCIAAGLREDPDLVVRTATLGEPEHGLTNQALAETDVLIWRGHAAHGQVADEVSIASLGASGKEWDSSPSNRRIIQKFSGA